MMKKKQFQISMLTNKQVILKYFEHWNDVQYTIEIHKR